MSNQSIMDKGKQYVMNTYGRFPISLVKGKGALAWDADGKEYVDMVGGIAVCSLGHAHPELVAVLKDQAEKLWHCSNLYWIEPQVELAEKLCQASGMSKAFFANSGAEANEGAIKLARKYFSKQDQDKYEIIAMNHSFHGRTTGSLALTGQTKYQNGFGPLLPGVSYAEYNDLDSVAALITEKTCAVIVEPVQGEGGVYPAELSFMKGLRALCDEKGILLIFDEVQCGMSRTGKVMAYDHYGVKPDVVTLAKALGGGFPISAMLAGEKCADVLGPGDHATTFGGNPLACAVASKMIDLLQDPALLQHVEEIAQYLTDQLNVLAEKEPRMVSVRGLGLLMGVEFSAEVKGLVNACMDNGLLTLSAGPNVLRLVPPLNITKAEIDRAMEILTQSLSQWQD